MHTSVLINFLFVSVHSITPAIYWNIPTFQCDWHHLNFSGLAAKYGIRQNTDDRFHGNHISILYDPGKFPAILTDSATGRRLLRNGGVPQDGNLDVHLELFTAHVNALIPNEQFNGIAVIDFESWRPIYRQNFGVLTPYKELSYDLAKRQHPLWPRFLIEKEAINQFEFYGRKFVEETLVLAKRLRPNARWGYYAYPYCFNMSPNHMRRRCPDQVITENDRLDWLYSRVDNLHPSIYLNQNLKPGEKIEMVEGRIEEAHRLRHQNTTQILPYFWYKYNDNKQFVDKDDIFNAMVTLSGLAIDGLILWGSSNDVNTRNKCYQLYDYIDNILGPALITSLGTPSVIEY